jgi:hypothetical protein
MRHCWYVRSGFRQPGSDPETGFAEISSKLTSWEFSLLLTNRPTLADFRGAIVRLEAAKSRHKVLDLAGRPGFAGFKVALDA